MFFSKKENNVGKENIWIPKRIYFSRQVLKIFVRSFQKQHPCPEGKEWKLGSFETSNPTGRDPQIQALWEGGMSSRLFLTHRWESLGVIARDVDSNALLQRCWIRVPRGVDWGSDLEQMPWVILMFRQVCFQSWIYGFNSSLCYLSLVIVGKLHTYLTSPSLSFSIYKTEMLLYRGVL